MSALPVVPQSVAEAIDTYYDAVFDWSGPGGSHSKLKASHTALLAAIADAIARPHDAEFVSRAKYDAIFAENSRNAIGWAETDAAYGRMATALAASEARVVELQRELRRHKAGDYEPVIGLHCRSPRGEGA